MIVSVFLDSNIIIYLIEQTPHFGALVTKRIEDLIAQEQRLLASGLVQMECSVRPFRMNDAITLAAYDGYFDSEDVDVAPITDLTCRLASVIRARHNFRPMDSLHLAAAIENRCELFLTHDTRLQRFPDIHVEVLA